MPRPPTSASPRASSRTSATLTTPLSARRTSGHDYTTRCARLPIRCRSPLTPKRRYRITENDEYAAFLRRVIRAYSRRVAAGDIEAITTMAHLADDLEDATFHAITGLREFGYSWADIAMRLGVTGRSPATLGEIPHPIATTSDARTSRSRP